jgi:hypothetical protein
MSNLDHLRMKFPFLAFLTDREIENLMSIVQSVSLGTTIRAEEILRYLNQESEMGEARC